MMDSKAAVSTDLRSNDDLAGLAIASHGRPTSSSMTASQVLSAGSQTASIIVPLYQYPLTPMTWVPLYNT